MVCEIELYERLAVSTTATPKEIQKSFRELSLIHHPDKIGRETSKYTGMVQANRILMDPELRRIYDSFGMAGLKFGDTGSHVKTNNYTAINVGTLINVLSILIVLVLLLYLIYNRQFIQSELRRSIVKIRQYSGEEANISENHAIQYNRNGENGIRDTRNIVTNGKSDDISVQFSKNGHRFKWPLKYVLPETCDHGQELYANELCSNRYSKMNLTQERTHSKRDSVEPEGLGPKPNIPSNSLVQFKNYDFKVHRELLRNVTSTVQILTTTLHQIKIVSFFWPENFQKLEAELNAVESKLGVLMFSRVNKQTVIQELEILSEDILKLAMMFRNNFVISEAYVSAHNMSKGDLETFENNLKLNLDVLIMNKE